MYEPDVYVRFQICIDIYASVEFGCVAIGEKNHVRVSAVQVGCEIAVPVPIVNTTRHRIRYYICDVHDQRPEPGVSPSSVYSAAGYEGEPETEEIEEEPETNEELDEIREDDDGESTVIAVHDSTIDPKGWYSPETLTRTIGRGDGRLPLFAFDEVAGQLGPNETHRLSLTFRPSRPTSYALRAKCYVMCDDFSEIISVLPVTVRASGCETRLEVRTLR